MKTENASMCEILDNDLKTGQFTLAEREWIALVRYWQEFTLDSEYFSYRTGVVGNRDLHWRHFGYHRLSQLRNMLGSEKFQKVVDEVEDEFAKSQDPELWARFLLPLEERDPAGAELLRGMLALGEEIEANCAYESEGSSKTFLVNSEPKDD